MALLATGVPACSRVLTAIVSTASHFATPVDNLDGDQRPMEMSGGRRGLAPRAGADWRCRMRAATVIIAVALAWVPLPAVAFHPDEFCTTVTDIARRMNARAGRWLDRSTRHDGVEVDCGLKMLETKRFLKADPDALRESCEARQQRAWNAAYCNNEVARGHRQRLEHHLHDNVPHRRDRFVCRRVLMRPGPQAELHGR